MESDKHMVVDGVASPDYVGRGQFIEPGRLKMRMPRIKVHGQAAVYHCISRIVGGRFPVKDLERGKPRESMWKQ
jgi:hypothetical protein